MQTLKVQLSNNQDLRFRFSVTPRSIELEKTFRCLKKLNLYFEAIGLADNRQRLYLLLINLSEGAFRLAESIDLPESNDWETFVDCLKTLFERNQTGTEKRYSFHKRVQQPDESVDSFALTLRELGSKFGFNGEEYNHRLAEQFILGFRHRIRCYKNQPWI